MPKQTFSIPNDVLWARLGDRTTLSDELWLIASQVGMLLGRSTDQLAEDRKVGNPPAFKKDGGSIRYRLGTVRDHMFNSPEFFTTTQSKLNTYKNRFGHCRDLLNENSSDWTPYHRAVMIRRDNQVIDFWESLKLGDRLSESDYCEWITIEDYLLEPHKEMAMRQEFLLFIEHLASLRLEGITPSRIAEVPFDKIYAPIHLQWIWEIIADTTKNWESLGAMAMATLHETLQCKSQYWSIPEGIHRLLNESPWILTNTSQLRQGEIAGYVKAATCAASDGSLPKIVLASGEIAVESKNLLAWAKDNNLPVDSKVESAIKGRVLGSIKRKGRPVVDAR